MTSRRYAEMSLSHGLTVVRDASVESRVRPSYEPLRAHFADCAAAFIKKQYYFL